MKKTLYFHPDQASALNDFSQQLLRFIKKTKKDSQTLVLVCIGTDRATGDCLGPLVGHYLEQQLSSQLPFIFGNLSLFSQNLDMKCRINSFLISIGNILS